MAIVGARAATGYGEHVAATLAGALAADGAVVVSGGAYGIDGVAHRAALAAGGLTVALSAGGVDRPYPSGHTELFERIVRGGAVVSEVPCGTAPSKWRFLARNRTIAALGAATIVVEAGARSGSLNTAGHAAQLGRPLGAVPGPVTSAASVGCHRLLREYDAHCVTSAADVHELLGAPSPAHGGPPVDPRQTRVLDALSRRTAHSVEQIAARSGLAVIETTSVLGTLQLLGRAVRGPEGWRASH